MIHSLHYRVFVSAAFSALALCHQAMAQTGSSTLAPAEPAASTAVPSGVIPSATKPGPRLPTPEQKRDTAGFGSDLPLDRQVNPQVNIPFGKAPAPSATDARAARRGLPVTATGGINDAAASCEAQVNTASRTACLQRQNKK